MDEETKELLQKNLEVSEKTLKVVKKLHRAHIYRTALTTVKWLAIIGLLIFSFQQIRPYLSKLTQAYGSAFQILEQINQVLPRR